MPDAPELYVMGRRLDEDFVVGCKDKEESQDNLSIYAGCFGVDGTLGLAAAMLGLPFIHC